MTRLINYLYYNNTTLISHIILKHLKPKIYQLLYTITVDIMSHCLHPLHVKLPGAHVPEKSTVGPIGSHYLSFLFKDCLPTFYRVLAGPKVYINFMPPNIQMDEKQWNKWQIASYSYIRNYIRLVSIVIIP